MELGSEVSALRDTLDALPDVVAGDPDSGRARLRGAELHELLLELMALSDVLDATIATVAAQWDRDGYWARNGSRSPAHRLARDTRHSVTACRRLVSRARRVQETAVRVGQVWGEGDLTTGTVDLLLRAATPDRADAFTRDQSLLVDQVKHLTHHDATRALQYWTQHVEAETGSDGPAPEPARHLTTAETFDGAVSVSGVLDPVGGAVVSETLRLIGNELTLADQAAGRVRNAAERSADALVEMAIRARDARAGKRSRPLITVITGSQALAHLCELDSGAVVTPADLVSYLNEAMVQVFHFDAAGQPTSASRVRTYRGTLRRAIQIRDRHCQHESGCTEPIVGCDLDHRTPYAHGGATTLTQGRLLCPAHNRIPHLRDPIYPDPPEPHRRQ